MAYVYSHEPSIDRSQRSLLKNQRSSLVWLTGLSGSGKSTIASALEKSLYDRGFHTYSLDGDNLRQGLCSDLGFDEIDRIENIRRVGEVAALMVDAGLIVIASFISPFERERQLVRRLFENGEFVEVYVSTSLAVCEQRDPKGLYRKARAGVIDQFTGISSPYEEPKDPDLTIDGEKIDPSTSASMIIEVLTRRGVLAR
ncbi:adenylyl-sulfate kinase [Marinimicrobium alkaliphilum]|uniref:adenylyl-sulfate kinase n=1 Tax=Marinimicrobium alkaliphilum TaxID=2202654 RepID=UPI000DB93CA7|nr:adenylyl-sulfate kinase [Marinimicrobium alkaliphilum]